MSYIPSKAHFWGVVAQCKNPYREFAICSRCGRYRENGILMSKTEFRQLAASLTATNPMYEPDSTRLLEVAK